MADETENKKPRKESDVKQSFAWGQLFASSLIGGLAVWKLLHKMTNTEPSEWFRGLSVAYEQWRDWLMTPFQWIQLDLTSSEKNVLAICLVLIGALLRSLVRFPKLLPTNLALVVIIAAFVTWFAWGIVTSWTDVRGIIVIIFVALCGVSILSPILLLLNTNTTFFGEVDPGDFYRDELGFNSFVLLNILFTALWGIALLLLNWATS